MTKKFLVDDVAKLRRELLQAGLDWLQAAEVISGFVAVHGYGMSRENSLGAARLIDDRRYSTEHLHEELEILALAM